MSPSSARTTARATTLTERELLQKLQTNIGSVAITSTVRAARGLRQHYNQLQHASGNVGWATPEILAWEPWLKTLWGAAALRGTEARLLLTEVQELELWHRILVQDDAARQTLSIDALAETAQQAWKQMHQYKIPLASVRMDSSVDAKAFYRWAIEFEAVCRKASFLSPSSIEAAIAQWIPSEEIHLPKEIFLLGFDRVTPSQTLLIDALDARGCTVYFVELQPAGTPALHRAIVYADTQEEEIVSAAHWIRNALLANPTQRIGVIVPALEDVRGTIDATFRRVLAPSSMDVRAPRTSLPYEFSLGDPMHRLQPIRTAMTLLRWLQKPILPEDVSWLIVQGGFGDGFEGSPDARARLDRKFRERDFQPGGPVSLSVFRRWLSQSGSREESVGFRQTVKRFFIAGGRSSLEKPRSFAEWRETVEDLLAAAEWRLSVTADSTDYQLLQRWNALLDDLSSLNSVADPVKFSAMMDKLEHLAAHMLFTLKTRNTPVQVLGISESAGLVFDSVWWMNAQANLWPPRGKAQPFLPWNLQREAHMPYADPAEDFVFALRTTKRILDAGPTAIVSFALQESDAANASAHIPDREILLSPLVREVLPTTPIVSADEFLPEMLKHQTAQDNLPPGTGLERVHEEPAVPFQGTEVRGGVRFLELHAACPFRAFAELRLGTRPLADPGTGLSPNIQGSIVHKVLDKFWKKMKSRKDLLERPIEQLRLDLRGHIDSALEEFFEHATEPWQEALLKIEAERIEARLLEWLEVEKQRPEFTVLRTEDALEHIHLGGIELRCRIDRIDEVDQGIVLMDYKTGTVDRNACEGDRPDQPQLPAYAVLQQQAAAAEKALAGVAFASLHPGKVEFMPVSSLPGIFPTAPGKREDKRSAASPEAIQQQQESWSVTLTRLAEEFRAGAAIVDPKNTNKTCKACEQTPLCRVRETSAAVESAFEEDDEESDSSTGIPEP